MGTDARMDLYLVRHGMTQWNKEKRYLGHSDMGVLEKSLEDLESLKVVLANLERPVLVSSDLRRCRETADYLFPAENYETDRRLREFNFGEWEGRTYEELKDVEAYRRWLDDWKNNEVPGGDSGESFSMRIWEWWTEFLKMAEVGAAEIGGQEKFSAVVVTHGGVIRLLTMFAFGENQGEDFWKRGAVLHGEGLKLEMVLEGGEWRCSSSSVVPVRAKERQQ